MLDFTRIILPSKQTICLQGVYAESQAVYAATVVESNIKFTKRLSKCIKRLVCMFYDMLLFKICINAATINVDIPSYCNMLDTGGRRFYILFIRVNYLLTWSVWERADNLRYNWDSYVLIY